MNRYIDYQYMDRQHIATLLSEIVNNTPRSEKQVLEHLLLDGAETTYGLSKQLGISISTVGSAVRRLEEDGSVTVIERTEERGRSKVYHGLTLRGLARALKQIYYLLNDRTLVKRRISRGLQNWSSLAPEFFECWKNLTDDEKHPGASDYWCNILERMIEYWYDDSFVRFIQQRWDMSEFSVTYSVGVVMYDLMTANDIPPRAGITALKETPCWNEVQFVLSSFRDKLKEVIEEMDSLLE